MPRFFQAMLIGYQQLRDYEEAEERISMMKAMVARG